MCADWLATRGSGSAFTVFTDVMLKKLKTGDVLEPTDLQKQKNTSKWSEANNRQGGFQNLAAPFAFCRSANQVSLPPKLLGKHLQCHTNCSQHINLRQRR